MASLIIVIPALFISSVCAEEIIAEGQNQSVTGDKGDLNLNRAYLELFYNKDDIRRIRSQSETIDKELDGTAELSESFKPLEKTVQTIDKIYLHPKRSVTLMLPVGSQVTRISPTFDAKFIEFDEAHPTNIFTILSMPAFMSGDLTVYYSINGKNYVMKVICEKYGQTKDQTQVYHSVIAYRDAVNLSAFEVMAAYKKEYSVYPNRQYSFITIGGIAYKIIEDEQYGTLTVPNGKKYRIETQVNQRN